MSRGLGTAIGDLASYVAERTAVLAECAKLAKGFQLGSGTGPSAPRTLIHDGSYRLEATCTGGGSVVVRTAGADGEAVRVPCTDVATRVRILSDERFASWHVEADGHRRGPSRGLTGSRTDLAP